MGIYAVIFALIATGSFLNALRPFLLRLVLLPAPEGEAGLVVVGVVVVLLLLLLLVVVVVVVVVKTLSGSALIKKCYFKDPP